MCSIFVTVLRIASSNTTCVTSLYQVQCTCHTVTPCRTSLHFYNALMSDIIVPVTAVRAVWHHCTWNAPLFDSIVPVTAVHTVWHHYTCNAPMSDILPCHLHNVSRCLCWAPVGKVCSVCHTLNIIIIIKVMILMMIMIMMLSSSKVTFCAIFEFLLSCTSFVAC